MGRPRTTRWKLFRRAKAGAWQVELYDRDGQRVRRSTGTTDRAAAEEFAEQLWRDENRVTSATAGTDVTLLQLAALWLKASEGRLKASTLGFYKDNVRAYVLRYFDPHREARTITRADVEAFRDAVIAGRLKTKRQRRGARPAAGTVNRVMTTLRRIFDHGVRRGLLPSNPAANLPAIRERSSEPFRALSEEEVDRLVAVLEAGAHRHAGAAARWVRLLVATGMRLSEAAELDWQQVDMQRRFIRLRPEQTKNGRARRIPLTSAARDALNDLAHAAGSWEGSVLPHRDHRGAVAAAWAADEQLVGRAPTAHDFRHTCASRAVAAGLDLRELMEWFGWTSVTIPQVYLHLYGDRWENMLEKMERAAGSGVPKLRQNHR